MVRKENKEATGVCLVLDNKYFNNSYTSPYSYEYESKINYAIMKELKSSIKVDENKTVNDIDSEEIPFIQKEIYTGCFIIMRKKISLFTIKKNLNMQAILLI
ncbi:hypothetical protein [Brachyspira hyodysenteriae]|uniref:hypothetical protein n=1 Tax=Brachyspira hyodysenteriae TaxID=159 RepID=UPI0030CA1860